MYCMRLKNTVRNDGGDGGDGDSWSKTHKTLFANPVSTVHVLHADVKLVPRMIPRVEK